MGRSSSKRGWCSLGSWLPRLIAVGLGLAVFLVFRSSAGLHQSRPLELKLQPDAKLLDPRVALDRRRRTAAPRPAVGPKEPSVESSLRPVPKAGHSLDAGCPRLAKSKASWREVESKDLKLIRAQDDHSVVERCERLGGALLLTLRLSAAKKAQDKAYQVPFPDYIVADELGASDWRSKRSTLQLYVLAESDRHQVLKPLGPAHADHEYISKVGDGSYSHWRPAMTSGPAGKSNLRFSTPRNVPLSKVAGLVAVVYPMAPAMGWIEFVAGKRVKHQEIFRELYFQTFPTVGVEPQLVEKPEQVQPGAHYLWRIGGNQEFKLPLARGEIYEKRLPYQIAEHYGQFEQMGGRLYPPPASYVYYQNKVALAELFKRNNVKTPETWIFKSAEEALRSKSQVSFPVVIKDPYGFSSKGIRQATDWEEFQASIRSFFKDVGAGIEAIVQKKVVALREARVTYIDGKPFHGYWRQRKSLDSASAASNLGGFQSFDFPLADIAQVVAQFANKTGVPVGGVDFIWKEEDPDVTKEPFALEVSPTSDLNPPSPAHWRHTYAEFKKTHGYRAAYLEVRRQWTDLMALTVIDQHRRSKRHLFVDIDNVVSLSAARVLRWKGDKHAYRAKEVLQDEPVTDAVEALKELRKIFFVRFLTARGQYEDAFNVTLTWLAKQGFEYDELIVVKGAEDKVAHMTKDSLLIDDFTVGHEHEVPKENSKFKRQLEKAGLPFMVFPFGGRWADVLPKLREEAKRIPGSQ